MSRTAIFDCSPLRRHFQHTTRETKKKNNKQTERASHFFLDVPYFIALDDIEMFMAVAI